MGDGDSVSLESEARKASDPGGGRFTWQNGLVLFLLYLLVVSDFFVNNVLSLYPGATEGREASNVGAVVQGVVLVLLYALVNYLLKKEIL